MASSNPAASQAAVLLRALLETSKIEILNGRKYITLRLPCGEGSSTEAEELLHANRDAQSFRRETHRRRRIVQKRLPRNKDHAIRVTECHRGRLGYTWVNFHRKHDEEEIRLIVRHLNSVELRKCNRYSKGFLCAALNSELNGDVFNEQFVRAVVLGPGRDDSLVKVRFIDFNIVDEVEKTSLRHLPRKLRRLPALAHYGVLVNTDRRDKEAQELQASRMIDSDETIVRVLKYHKKRNFYEVYVYEPNERHVDAAGF